jgi:hypothetical protein
VRDALKRLKWTTRDSGARVIVIFFIASRSCLHFGQRHTSSPLRRSVEQYERRQSLKSQALSRGISTLMLQKASYVVLVVPHVLHRSCEACWPANNEPIMDCSRCRYLSHSIRATYGRGRFSRISSSLSVRAFKGVRFHVTFKSSCR